MTLALLPVKRLDRAKGRLAELLSPAEREQLALATLRTVLAALEDAGMKALILTPDAEHLREALGGNAEILQEEPEAARGLNPQLERAVTRLLEAGGLAELLILHADLPLASGDELRRLAAAEPRANTVTMVRSRDGGTNAMLMRPPGRFPLAYGTGSFAKHEMAARAAGMSVAAVESEALSLDLDTPPDLGALLAIPGGRQTRAGRLLLQLSIDARLEAAG